MDNLSSKKCPICLDRNTRKEIEFWSVFILYKERIPIYKDYPKTDQSMIISKCYDP